MAATEKGVWDLQEVRDKQLVSEWTYEGYSSAGELYSWGENVYGVLGHNQVHTISPTANKQTPTQVPGTTWQDLAGGGAEVSVSFATKSDGTLWSWGRNLSGVLGHDDEVDRSSPTQVGTDTTWTNRTDEEEFNGLYKITRSTSTCLAIKTDGTLWSWGGNGYGALLNNLPSTIKRSSPTQVGTDTTWKALNYGRDSGFHAVKTDGTLWAWGRNTYGRLGLNNTVNYSSPTQMPGTTWDKIGGQGQVHMATKTDGTLYAWGNNTYGQLAQNSTSGRRSSPMQIPGTTWRDVGTSAEGCMSATKTDGTLWMWGYQEYGQYGLNSTSPTIIRSSPVQLPGTNWATICTSSIGSLLATKTDGTLWSWGLNNSQQLGLPQNNYRSSPTQIGTDTTWTKKLMGIKYGGFAIKTS
tara:strand:- start:84 stop:1310 length:1227 start_codon:yes stop_codon:yes gene_type:complete